MHESTTDTLHLNTDTHTFTHTMFHVSLLLMNDDPISVTIIKPISFIHLCLRYLDRGPASEIVASCPLYVGCCCLRVVY